MEEKEASFESYPTPFLPPLAEKMGDDRLKEKGGIIPETKEFAFSRVYQNDAFCFSTSYKSSLENRKPHLYTNLLGETKSLPMELAEAEAKIELQPKSVGRFFAKVQSVDQDNKVHWNPAEALTLWVDPAGLKRVRLYTFIPSASGHMGDWKLWLHHIKNMGFDAVHLLPITFMDQSQSPYSAKNLFDIDPSFCDPSDSRPALEQFQDFVLLAKELGLRLCFDIVLNHVGTTSDLVKSRPYWIQHDPQEADGLKRAGCWHENNWIAWRDLALINFEHIDPQAQADIRAYMLEYVRFWAHYANFTEGFIRLDNLHSSNADFIDALFQDLRERYPQLISLGEFFADHKTLMKSTRRWGLHLLLGQIWYAGYAENMRSYLLHMHDISHQLLHLLCLSTHDSPAPSELYGSPQAILPRYLACALLGTGQTGIVQGTEFAYPSKMEFIGKPTKYDFRTKAGLDFSAGFHLINSLLAKNDAFIQKKNLSFVDNNHFAVLAGIREDALNKRRWLVMANLDIKDSHTISLKIDRTPRRVHDLREDKELPANTLDQVLNLPPSHWTIYLLED